VGLLNWNQEHKSVWDGPASKATGHAPRPARDWPVPKSANVLACAPTAGHCAVQCSWPVQTFSKSAISHNFPNFYTFKGLNFPDVLSVHVYLWPLWSWTMKSFMEIGPHVFEKSGKAVLMRRPCYCHHFQKRQDVFGFWRNKRADVSAEDLVYYWRQPRRHATSPAIRVCCMAL